MGKGSKQRPTDRKKFEDNYDRIYGNKTDTLHDLVLAYLDVSMRIDAAPDYDSIIVLSEDRKKVHRALSTLDRCEVAYMAHRLLSAQERNITEVTLDMKRLAEEATEIAINFYYKKQKAYERFEIRPLSL